MSAVSAGGISRQMSGSISKGVVKGQQQADLAPARNNISIYQQQLRRNCVQLPPLRSPFRGPGQLLNNQNQSAPAFRSPKGAEPSQLGPSIILHPSDPQKEQQEALVCQFYGQLQATRPIKWSKFVLCCFCGQMAGRVANSSQTKRPGRDHLLPTASNWSDPAARSEPSRAVGLSPPR